jgi:hypothetical protein
MRETINRNMMSKNPGMLVPHDKKNNKKSGYVLM